MPPIITTSDVSKVPKYCTTLLCLVGYYTEVQRSQRPYIRNILCSNTGIYRMIGVPAAFNLDAMK